MLFWIPTGELIGWFCLILKTCTEIVHAIGGFFRFKMLTSSTAMVTIHRISPYIQHFLKTRLIVVSFFILRDLSH